MVQPINYAIDIPDPSQAFLQAFKTGTAVTETRMAQEQAQRQAEQQKQIQESFARLRQPGATARDYANLSMLLPETQAKAVRESFSMLNADQQQFARAQAGQVFSAFRSGRPEIAINLIERQIEAKRNSGDEQGAKFGIDVYPSPTNNTLNINLSNNRSNKHNRFICNNWRKCHK